nr:sialidase family protein [Candidatus Sigynarchaeota archaeon]
MTVKIAPGIDIQPLTQVVPGQLHHAHCSGIVAFPDGKLLAVFYWAIKEAQHEQKIYATRKRPGDAAWSAPEAILADRIGMVGNPSIWIAPDTSRLWLFFVRSVGGWSVCQPRFVHSDDQGKTWSKPRNLYWFISRGIKNPPIVTKTGRYVLPAYVEFRDYFGVFYLSDDQGKTWRERARVAVPDDEIPNVPLARRWGRLVEQPTVVERKDGSLWALFRTEPQMGVMYQSESKDGGETWTPAKPYMLPNPGGGFHMMRLQSGNIAIIYNHAPVKAANHGFERNPLSVAISEDDGKSWKWRRNIIESREGKEEARIGQYPTMTQGPDGRIHATWSYGHHVMVNGQDTSVTDIYYTSFTEAWIKEKVFFESPWEP